MVLTRTVWQWQARVGSSAVVAAGTYFCLTVLLLLRLDLECRGVEEGRGGVCKGSDPPHCKQLDTTAYLSLYDQYRSRRLFTLTPIYWNRLKGQTESA